MPGELVLVIDDSPTILKVVQLVLTKARYRVETAADGEDGLALARSVKPTMILLDFVMPRMNGYQFCREMASDPELKDIPIVLMSAKGDQVGERFIKVMGIVDYITKPFSPEAITTVVQHTISKYARRSPEADQDLLADVADLDVAEPEDEAAEERHQAKLAALAEARSRIAELVAERATAGNALDVMDAETTLETELPGDAALLYAGDLGDRVRDALDDMELAAIIARAAPAVIGAAAEPSLSGDLRAVPIADVLQLLDTQEQSGILAMQKSPGSQVEIYFRKGRIELAVAAGVPEEFLLGRFIVSSELMTGDAFADFLRTRPREDGLIGRQLVNLGHIGEDNLKDALKQQTRELVYEVLRWRAGSFAFTAGRELPPAAEDAALGLELGEILMEGFRRVDEWHLIEREVDDFNLVFVRNDTAVAQMGNKRLNREELAVLDLVNGKNTVKDIIRHSRMSSFEVSKMIYRLLSIKLIRRRVMPVAV